MPRLIKALIIMAPALLLIAGTPSWAGYCVNFSNALREADAKYGSGRTKASFATKEECEAYVRQSNSSSVHQYDLSGGCYPCSGGSSLPGFSGGKGKKGSTDAAIKQTLVEGMVQGILGPALNPSPPKKGTGVSKKPSASALSMQQKYEQQQREEAAREAAFSADQQRLLTDLKGDVSLSRPNTIDLKMPPEATASGQLGLLDREGRQAAAKGKRSDWENPPKTLPSAVTPTIPEPSAPVSAEGDLKGKPLPEEMLKGLLEKITTSRTHVEKLDQEVKHLEETVAKEEKKAATEKKPEDDSLRKAREALQRAKENREKTAAELKRLEEQAAQARSASQSAPAGQQ